MDHPEAWTLFKNRDGATDLSRAEIDAVVAALGPSSRHLYEAAPAARVSKDRKSVYFRTTSGGSVCQAIES